MSHVMGAIAKSALPNGSMKKARDEVRCVRFCLTDGVPFGFDYVHVPMEVVGNIYDNPELLEEE